MLSSASTVSPDGDGRGGTGGMPAAYPRPPVIRLVALTLSRKRLTRHISYVRVETLIVYLPLVELPGAIMTASETPEGAAAPPLIEASGLCVRFGKVTALDGLDLVARPGQVLAIRGPNGAGKTTFTRTVATLVAPTAGRLRVRGIDVTRDPAAVRREIGLAGQFAAVEPSMTGRENLRMVARLFGHRRAAAAAAAESVIDLLGLGGGAGPRAGDYSRGPRR